MTIVSTKIPPQLVVKPGRTSAYQFTVTSRDNPQLEAVRNAVKSLNKLGELRHPMRVSVRGRRPTTGYTFGGAVIGGLDNATEFDVYIHRR